MIMAVPQYRVTFAPKAGQSFTWVVNGERELEALCHVLRWNGITAYSVSPNLEKGG